MKRGGRKSAAIQYDTDSDEEPVEDQTPAKHTHLDECPRSSKRIQLKNSKTFHLPDKKSVFDGIPTLVSTGNSTDRLKPRKLVNNFTRITHRYNYDKVSSDDSENADFIDDGPLYHRQSDYSDEQDNDSNSEEDEDASVENNKSFSLEQRHHISILESDSDTDDSSGNQRLRHNSVIIESDSDQEEHTKSEVDVSQVCTDVKKEDIENNETVNRNTTGCNQTESNATESNCKVKSEQNSESSDTELISPIASSRKKLHKISQKRAVLQSDSDSDSEHCGKTKRRVVLMQEEDSDTESSDSSDLERLYSSNEDDDKLPSERAQLMAYRREKHISLFEQLKAKRKSPKEKS